MMSRERVDTLSEISNVVFEGVNHMDRRRRIPVMGLPDSRGYAAMDISTGERMSKV